MKFIVLVLLLILWALTLFCANIHVTFSDGYKINLWGWFSGNRSKV